MKRIEFEHWIQDTENPRKLTYAGQRTAEDVFHELEAHLDSVGYLPDEYLLLDSILRKAAWLSFPVVCRSGTGRTKKATSAARRKFSPKTSILETARRRTMAVLLPHPRRVSVRLHSQAALRPTLAAHSPAASCRTSAEAFKRIWGRISVHSGVPMTS